MRIPTLFLELSHRTHHSLYQVVLSYKTFVGTGRSQWHLHVKLNRYYLEIYTQYSVLVVSTR